MDPGRLCLSGVLIGLVNGCARGPAGPVKDPASTSTTESDPPPVEESLQERLHEPTIIGRTLEGDLTSARLAVLSTDSLTVSIYDLGTLGVLPHLRDITLPAGRALDLWVEGELLLVVMESLSPGRGDLLVYDLANPDSIHVAAGLDLDWAHSVVVRDSFAYVANWQGVTVVQLNDGEPNEAGRWLSPDPVLEPDELFLLGDRLYLGGVGALGVVDVSDPSQPTTVTLVPYEGAVLHNIAGTAGALYTTDESVDGAFRVWNLDDPDLPIPGEPLSNLTNPMIYPLAVAHDHLAGAFYHDGVRVWSVAEPTELDEVAQFDTCGCDSDTARPGDGAQVLWAEGTLIAAIDLPGGLYLWEWAP